MTNKNIYEQFAFPVLKQTDPEMIHNATMALLSLASKTSFGMQIMEKAFPLRDDPRLRVNLFGLNYRNPVGLAAGFDKQAVAIPALAQVGFGHIEIGTVTPEPQPGNPQPRLFRLTEDMAIINRMGFNSIGAEEVLRSLKNLNERKAVIGINVGANKANLLALDFDGAISDYVRGLQLFYPYADYFSIGISSPNTPNLRQLQTKEFFPRLIENIAQARNDMGTYKPVLIKIAPDLEFEEIHRMVHVMMANHIDGVIATNTTTARPDSLKSKYKAEIGGLSGKPLQQKSDDIIRHIYRTTHGEFPIIGVGGIFDGEDAIKKIKAGASLIQIYTGMIYRGPTLVERINREVSLYLEREGMSLAKLVGSDN